MHYSESIHLAIAAIRSNKMRSVLTLLGIIIGVMTIIAMQSLITGLRNSINQQLNVLGSNVFQVQKYPAIQTGELDKKIRNRKNLTFEQAMAVRENVTSAVAVGAETDQWGLEIRYQEKKTLPNVSVVGATPEYLTNNGYDISSGRFLTEQDVDFDRSIAVIGVDVASKLFSSEDPIGRDVKIQGQRYEVIGVFEKMGSIFGNSRDNLVVIPITSFQKEFGRWRSVSISVQARSSILYQETVDQTIGVLRAVRNVPPGEENDFDIFSNDTLINFFDNLTKYVRIVAIAIASISLIVAGVGIMNIMLVSVTERTREIGIRKSLGAKRRDILWQFLIEAVVLSEFGGIIGIILGLAFGKFIELVTPVPTAVPVWTVFLGLIFCSGVGMVFGVYPATKAARMDPIEALRYE
jgi:putative ABC transport system permease protein